MSHQNTRPSRAPTLEKVTCKHCGSHQVRITEIDITAGQNTARIFPDGCVCKGSPGDDPIIISPKLVCQDCDRCTGLTIGQSRGQVAFTIAAEPPDDPIPRPTLH